MQDTPFSIVSVQELRNEADDDPNLTDEQIEVLRTATDEQVEEALRDAFGYLENQFFDLHDALQSMAKTFLYSIVNS